MVQHSGKNDTKVCRRTNFQTIPGIIHMKGSAWGNWDPQEVQQPFLPYPNGVGNRTTTLRQLLVGAVDNTSIEPPVAPSPAASRPPLSLFFSLRPLYPPPPTSHPVSFHSFILQAGSSFPNLLFYFRFGQTRSETKTLRIVLESLCIH